MRKFGAIALVLLFLLLFSIYFSNTRILMTGDTVPAALLPFNILENHEVQFDRMGSVSQFAEYYDRMGWQQWFFLESKGHVVSMYPIVTPVLITPLYVLPYLLMKWVQLPISIYNPGFQIAALYMERLSAAAIAALSGIFIYLSMKELASRRVALMTTLTYALATCIWSISSQELWQQGMSALLLSLIILLVILNEKRRDDKKVLFLGVLSGLYVFNRPSDFPLLLPLLFYIVTLKDRRILYYLGTMSLASLPFILYNVHYFGSIFGGYGAVMYFNFDLRAATGFLGMLVSPSRGLFVYTPIVLLAIPGFFRAIRSCEGRLRGFLYASGPALLLFTLVYGCYVIWWAGGSYGPRFLTSALPFLALFVGLSIPEISLKGLSIRKALYVVLFLALLVPSVFVQIVGVYYYPSGGWDYSPTNIDHDPGRLWDVNDSQILRNYNAGPMPGTDPRIDLYTVLGYKRFLFLDGWYTLEYWAKPPLIACENRSKLAFYSYGGGESALNFRANSFFQPRTLQIYQNGELIYNDTIPQEGRSVKVPIKAMAGQNILEFYSAEPSQRSCDVPGSGLADPRKLSFYLVDMHVT